MAARHTVLVVDDDDELRQSFVDVLEDHGFTAPSARDGAEALAMLRRLAEPPCVVLLDLMMPVLDGRGFCEAQMRDPLLADLPVVVVSADRDPISRAEGMPVAGHLKKPMSPEALVAAVRRFCRRAHDDRA